MKFKITRDLEKIYKRWILFGYTEKNFRVHLYQLEQMGFRLAESDDTKLTLKPCPWCGPGGIKVDETVIGTYAVVCEQCGITGKYEDEKGDAVVSWNRRYK